MGGVTMPFATLYSLISLPNSLSPLSCTLCVSQVEQYRVMLMEQIRSDELYKASVRQGQTDEGANFHQNLVRPSQICEPASFIRLGMAAAWSLKHGAHPCADPFCSFLAMCLQIREEARLKTVRDKMISDLVARGVNEQYLSEMRNLDIGKILRR